MKPRIGIRPTIDGRWGGVRESLEEKTMAMANAAKELIESNVHYQDGTPVECVISPCTIGSGAEAAKCNDYFSTQNVCATLAVTPCWCYGSETMDLNSDTVKAVWGFNGTERPGAVYLAAVMAAFAQRGLPAFSMYGHDVQDIDDNTVPEDVAEKMIRWAKGAVAVGQMKNKAYVNLGSVAMGIAGSYCDMSFMQKYLGIRAEFVDLTEILRRITLGIYDKDEYEKAKSDHQQLQDEIQILLDKYHDDGKDPNPMAKGMSWFKTNIKISADSSDNTIADLITDGCNMGVKTLHKYLNKYKAADEKSKDIAKKLINIEEELTVDMRSYL